MCISNSARSTDKPDQIRFLLLYCPVPAFWGSDSNLHPLAPLTATAVRESQRIPQILGLLEGQPRHGVVPPSSSLLKADPTCHFWENKAGNPGIVYLITWANDVSWSVILFSSPASEISAAKPHILGDARYYQTECFSGLAAESRRQAHAESSQ
jgi:hypothetical protein